MQPGYKVADVLRTMGNAVEQMGLNTHQLKTLRAIRDCRTAALGGHVDCCSDCGVVQISYNSCRNRHCPTCQGHQRQAWILARMAELLPVPYFHVVFTLPDKLNKLAVHQPATVYDALFAAAWQTVQSFGKQQQLQLGMISVLHTWGQNLVLHPHLHCIVPGAGVNKSNQLIKVRGKGKYLFAVKAMSKVFRAKYVSALRQSGIQDKALLNDLFSKDWVVYAKRPFGNPMSVIEYLGRYTHKVAIGNQRIKEVTDTTVSFDYKDYKQGAAKKTMELGHQEFVRRFALHILPHRFVRIRHYGMLSSTWKRGKLQQYLGQPLQTKEQAMGQTMLHRCPHCRTGTMITIEVFGKRGPPEKYITAKQDLTVA